MYGLLVRESCLDQQLDFALVAISGERSTVTSWIASREQKTAAGCEVTFELHLFRQQVRKWMLLKLVAYHAIHKPASPSECPLFAVCHPRQRLWRAREILSYSQRRCDRDTFFNQVLRHRSHIGTIYIQLRIEKGHSFQEIWTKSSTLVGIELFVKRQA